MIIISTSSTARTLPIVTADKNTRGWYTGCGGLICCVWFLWFIIRIRTNQHHCCSDRPQAPTRPYLNPASVDIHKLCRSVCCPPAARRLTHLDPLLQLVRWDAASWRWRLEEEDGGVNRFFFRSRMPGPKAVLLFWIEAERNNFHLNIY